MVLPTRFLVTLPKFYHVALIDHDVHSDECSVNGPLYFAVQAIQVRLNLVCERKYKAIVVAGLGSYSDIRDTCSISRVDVRCAMTPHYIPRELT